MATSGERLSVLLQRRTTEACVGADDCVVALSRYQTIINTTESGEIDYDGVDSGTTKPTKAAIRVNDLLETVTGLTTSLEYQRKHAILKL